MTAFCFSSFLDPAATPASDAFPDCNSPSMLRLPESLRHAEVSSNGYTYNNTTFLWKTGSGRRGGDSPSAYYFTYKTQTLNLLSATYLPV